MCNDCIGNFSIEYYTAAPTAEVTYRLPASTTAEAITFARAEAERCQEYRVWLINDDNDTLVEF